MAILGCHISLEIVGLTKGLLINYQSLSGSNPLVRLYVSGVWHWGGTLRFPQFLSIVGGLTCLKTYICQNGSFPW